MILEGDWKSGTATYSYLKDGEMITVKNQKVEAVDLEANNFSELSEQVQELAAV